MKTLNLILFCLLLSICLKAQVPGMMSYQGYVTDPATNKPVTDGADYSITFKFYDGATEVTALERTVSNVSITKGLFTVIIGSDVTGANTSLPVGIWNKPLTVGVTAKKGTATGNEIVPRVTLTSTPYAFTAQVANVANSVSAANVTGTLAGSQVGSGVSALNISGTLPGSQVGSGVSATNITTGTLLGSLVGSGISASNITGSLPNSSIPSTIAPTIVNAADYITAVGGINSGGTADPNGNLVVSSGLLVVGSPTTSTFSVDIKSPASATTAVVRIDKTAAAGSSIIDIYRAGAIVANITESAGTVSYNTFTGSHFATCSEQMDIGTLVTLTGKSQRISSNPDSEPIYEVIVSTKANDPAILGSFLHEVEDINYENPIEGKINAIMAVGNGSMWIVDHGQNISVGDYLVSSSVKGHAMKDDPAFNVSYIVARAAEDIKWEDISTTINGIKHKKISVFFESFMANHEAERNERVIEELKNEIGDLKGRLNEIEHMLNLNASKKQK